MSRTLFVANRRQRCEGAKRGVRGGEVVGKVVGAMSAISESSKKIADIIVADHGREGLEDAVVARAEDLLQAFAQELELHDTSSLVAA